jgi:putative FmdB family regulatory protein
MPTYTYRCNKCDEDTEKFNKMANMHDSPICECGGETKKIMNVCNIGAFSTQVHNNYESPIDGKVITSERQRQYDMESNGCRPWEGIKQEKKQVAKQKKINNDKLDKAVNKNLEKQIAQMPTEKKKRLGL